jgi:hypothetical protein
MILESHAVARATVEEEVHAPIAHELRGHVTSVY